MSDDDRPKKSWRDIDKGRDRSGGAKPRRDPDERGRQKVEKSAAYSKYKSQLDTLFTPGGTQLPESMRAKLGPTSPEAETKKKALEALRAKPGAATLRAALDAGAELPDDPRLLISLLDLNESELLPPVLDALIAHVEGGKKPSRMLLIQKLDAMKNRIDDDAVLELVSRLRAALD